MPEHLDRPSDVRPRWARWRRIVLWTAGWTLFQWWAVIGWPDSLEGSYAALMLVSSGTSISLGAWYLLGRLGPRPQPSAWTRGAAPPAAARSVGPGSADAGAAADARQPERPRR